MVTSYTLALDTNVHYVKDSERINEIQELQDVAETGEMSCDAPDSADSERVKGVRKSQGVAKQNETLEEMNQSTSHEEGKELHMKELSHSESGVLLAEFLC